MYTPCIVTLSSDTVKSSNATCNKNQYYPFIHPPVIIVVKNAFLTSNNDHSICAPDK